MKRILLRWAKRRSVWLALAAMALAACASSVPSSEDADVEHVVLVWLNDPGDTAARDALVRASLDFTHIDGVLAVRVGGPIPSERAIVDDTFDLAIVVALRDRAALDAYLAHPDHVRAGRELLGPAAARVLVYDVEVAGRAHHGSAGLADRP